MELKYISDIAFKYVVSNSNKDIKLSGELKEKFNYYYIEIKESDSFDKDRWVKEFQNLKSSVSKEIKETGNNKSIYVADYVEFIFGVSYLLFKKFHFSQNEVSKILGIKPTKYAKLGIYPYRCYSAYTKLDDKKNRKSLVPDDSNSIGIQIAECINKKVQAVYACSAFVGVSNDLDLFANISSTDRKTYVLTRPSTNEKFMEFVLSYPRFLFASGNNFENEIGNYKAGKVKEKIIDLLKMRDNKILRYSRYLPEVLQSSDEYKKYCSNSQSTIFKKDLEKYRRQLELMDRIGADDYYSDEIIYDFEYRKIVGIDADEIDFDLDDADKLYDYLNKTSQEIYSSLLNFFSYAGVSSFDKNLFEDYIYCMQMTLAENSKLPCETEYNFEYSLTEEEKIRLAAIYWILEVFSRESLTEQKYDSILNYLKSKKLLSYFDAINKEVKKGNKPHLFYKNEDFDISSILDEISGGNDVNTPPILLYIDVGNYKFKMGYADLLAKEKNIIMVVRNTEGFTDEWGMKLLDEQLSLYMKENQYAKI